MTANRVMALMSPTMTLISSGLTLAVYWIGSFLIEAAQQNEKLGIFSDMVVFSNYAFSTVNRLSQLRSAGQWNFAMYPSVIPARRRTL